MYSILFLAAISFLLCLLLTPIVRAWSRRQGWVDHPNAKRKFHREPTPRTGGIAIALSCGIGLSLLLLSPLNGADAVNLPLTVSLLPAAFAVFLVGLLDDVVGIRPWEKLLGQACAATLAWTAGVEVSGFAGFGVHGWLTLPLTVVWLVGCSNAFNLIDGMDGLATGIGLFASVTMLIAALLHHNIALAIATAPLVGALLAFLRYNFNPASIFLGDCGSLTIGFLLGCFAAMWSQKSASLVGMTAPLMVLALPLLDTGLAILRRVVRHQPIFSPDSNHIHHRLLARGFQPRQAVLVLYGVCGLGAAFSLIATVPGNHFSGLVLVLFGVVAWVGIHSLGYVEVSAARTVLSNGALRQLLHGRLALEAFQRQVAHARTADDYWEATRAVGAELGSAHVSMLLDGRLFEAGEWRPGSACTMRIPLPGDGFVSFDYAIESSMRHAAVSGVLADLYGRALAARYAAGGEGVASGGSTPAALEALPAARMARASYIRGRSVDATR